MCGSEDEVYDEAWEYYDKVRDALNGLFEVLSIALDQNSVFYQWGIDNLEALKGSLIDLLMKDYDTLELQDTLRKIEFNVKKNLFFEDPKKKEQTKNQDKEEAV
ncbi:MAG: hypothetical protein ACW986_09585 [Promethearchaeota archaeon]